MNTSLSRAFTLSLLVLLASCGGGGGGGGIGGGGIATPPAAGNPTVVPPVLSEIGAYDDVSQALYVTYFGRPATPAEVIALSTSLRAASAFTTMAGLEKDYTTKADVRRLVDAFALTREWKEHYFSTGYIGDDYGFVRGIYNNLFNRDPDIATSEKFVRAIGNAGGARAGVAIAMATGAQGADGDLVALKVSTARAFARALTSGGAASTYANPVHFAIARSMLQDVASAPEPAGVQAQLDATMKSLIDLSAGRFTEVPAAPHKVILLVAPDLAAGQASRLATLASVMADDMQSRAGPLGPRWSFVVQPAASTAYQVRQQLLDVQGAILIGQVPVPTIDGSPALDAYRMPKCKAIQFGDGAQIIPRTTVIEGDPACRNGATISVLRGSSSATESTEIARKLDQMIAYHRDSRAANTRWEPRYTLINASWAGGLQLPDASAFWDGISMFAKDKNTMIASGTSAHRRDAFLGCLTSNSEICKALVHGAAGAIQFEGPGTHGTFYSNEMTMLSSQELKGLPIKSKFIDMMSCSTQNFLEPNSFGTALLMEGDALLTSGNVSVSLVSDAFEQDTIINTYFHLNAGATFSDAWFGQVEHGPTAFQGDPYISMRPLAAPEKRPVLVINGKHYNSGPALVPIDFPDSMHARETSKLIVLTNAGTAELKVRIDSAVLKNAVNGAAEGTFESEFGYNAQLGWGNMLATPDGRVERPVVEVDGGRIALSIKPGGSVAYYYVLEVRTDADGKPKRKGVYSGEVVVLSNDPASSRVHLGVRAVVR